MKSAVKHIVQKALICGSVVLSSVNCHSQLKFSAFLDLNGHYTKLMPTTNRTILSEEKIWHFGISEGIGVDISYNRFHLQLSSTLMSNYINHDKTIDNKSSQNTCKIKRERYQGRVDQITSSFALGYNLLSKEQSKLILFLNAELINVLGKKDKESFVEYKHFDGSCDDLNEKDPFYYKYQKQELFYADPKRIFSASIHVEYRYLFKKFYLSAICGLNPFEKEVFSKPLIYSNISNSVFSTNIFTGFRLGYTIK